MALTATEAPWIRPTFAQAVIQALFAPFLIFMCEDMFLYRYNHIYVLNVL